jgi:hypothetical protein
MPLQLLQGDNFGSIASLYIARESQLRALVNTISTTLIAIDQAVFDQYFTRIPFLHSNAGLQQQAAIGSQGKAHTINIGVRFNGNDAGMPDLLATTCDFKLWAIAYDHQGHSYFAGHQHEGLQLVESFDTGGRIPDPLGWNLRFSGDFSRKLRSITIIPT